MAVQPEPRDASRDLWFDRWGIAVTVLVAAGVYLNSVDGAFVLDDVLLVVNNELIRSARHVPEILFSNVTSFLGAGGSSYYRPLPVLLLMALHSAFGLQPAAFHVASIALHAGSSVLVFLLGRQMLPRVSAFPALAGALLFAVHPVNSESVAWISAIQDAAATFFALLAIYAHARVDASRETRRWAAVSLVALACALLSKETALAAVPAMLTWDVFLRPDVLRPARRAVWRWGPVALVTAVYLAVRAVALGGLSPSAYGTASPPQAAPILLGRFVELLVAPFRLTVAHDVPVDASLLSGAALRAAVALAVLAVLAVVAWKRRARHAVWFVILAAPLIPPLYALAASSPVGLANRLAERHLYLSTAGLGLGLAAAIAWAESRSAVAFRAAIGIVGAIVILFAGLTIARNRVWQDELALWSDAAEKSPGIADVHFNLAVALRNRGDLDQSAAEFREAWRLNPPMILDRYAVGIRSMQAGEYRAAIPDLLVVTLAAPHIVQARYLLAEALRRTGRFQEAYVQYAEVLRVSPEHPDARRAMAELERGAQ